MNNRGDPLVVLRVLMADNAPLSANKLEMLAVWSVLGTYVKSASETSDKNSGHIIVCGGLMSVTHIYRYQYPWNSASKLSPDHPDTPFITD